MSRADIATETDSPGGGSATAVGELVRAGIQNTPSSRELADAWRVLTTTYPGHVPDSARVSAKIRQRIVDALALLGTPERYPVPTLPALWQEHVLALSRCAAGT